MGNAASAEATPLLSNESAVVTITPKLDLPYAIIHQIAAFLTGEETLIFRKIASLYDLAIIKRYPEHLVYAYLRKLLTADWVNSDITMTGRFPHPLWRQPVSIPKLDKALFPANATPTPKALVKKLCEPQHSAYLTTLISAPNKIAESTPGFITRLIFLSAPTIGSLVGSYFLFRLFTLPFLQYASHLGNICCLSKNPCVFDIPSTQSCSTILKGTSGAKSWLVERDALTTYFTSLNEFLGWAQQQCLILETKCHGWSTHFTTYAILGSATDDSGMTAGCGKSITVAILFTCLALLGIFIVSAILTACIADRLNYITTTSETAQPKIGNGDTHTRLADITARFFSDNRQHAADWERRLNTSASDGSNDSESKESAATMALQ